MVFKITNFLVFFILSITIFCSANDNQKNLRLEMMNAFCKEQVCRGLKSFGIGSGGPTLISSLSANFDSNQTMTLENSRKQILEVVNDLINKTNKTKKIRPYLIEFPFSANKIEIIIAYDDIKSGKPVEKPYVALVSCIQGKLTYSYYNKDVPSTYETFLTETYDEAMHIMQSQNNTN